VTTVTSRSTSSVRTSTTVSTTTTAVVTSTAVCNVVKNPSFEAPFTSSDWIVNTAGGATITRFQPGGVGASAPNSALGGSWVARYTGTTGSSGDVSQTIPVCPGTGTYEVTASFLAQSGTNMQARLCMPSGCTNWTTLANNAYISVSASTNYLPGSTTSVSLQMTGNGIIFADFVIAGSGS
jgi:hypothetical protein